MSLTIPTITWLAAHNRDYIPGTEGLSLKIAMYLLKVFIAKVFMKSNDWQAFGHNLSWPYQMQLNIPYVDLHREKKYIENLVETPDFN